MSWVKSSQVWCFFFLFLLYFVLLSWQQHHQLFFWGFIDSLKYIAIGSQANCIQHTFYPFKNPPWNSFFLSKGVVLNLLAMGLPDVVNFDFMSTPSENAIKDALEQLVLLQAVDTAHNQKVRTDCWPNYEMMLLSSDDWTVASWI